MQKLIAILLIIASISFIVLPLWFENFNSDACVEFDVDSGVALCAASDMAKLPNHGRVSLEHSSLAIGKGALQLNAARNETVAFQLVIQNRSNKEQESVKFVVADLTSESDKIEASEYISVYQAWYHHVNKGGYSWGPKSKVLRWPEDYPDALVPQFPLCSVGDQPLFTSVNVPEAVGGLQAMWIDVYIPKNQPTGLYKTKVTATLESGLSVDVPIELQVWAATLPDKPSISAIGEIYRAYKLEGAGFDISNTAWQNMSHCYQKMAHKHRMVFIERMAGMERGDSWQDYDDVYDPILNGHLFTKENGYIGPGENTPVDIWRTPWSQDFDVELKRALTNDEIERYRQLAEDWNRHSLEKTGYLQISSPMFLMRLTGQLRTQSLPSNAKSIWQ